MKLVLSVLLALCILPLPALAQSVCPSHLDSPQARGNLEALLTTEEFAEVSAQHNLSPLPDSSSVRVLTDMRDGAVCQILAQKVQADKYINHAPWKSVFYQAGDWYFVVSLMYPLEEYEVKVVDNTVSGAFYFVPVDAYDANLHRIGGWGL